MTNKISSSDYTNGGSLPYSGSAANGDSGLYPNQYNPGEEGTDSNNGEEREYKWVNESWGTNLAFYKSNPQSAASIDRKALWTVGQGFDFEGGVIKRFLAKKKMGIGKDTLTAIFYNLDRTGQIGGDILAEIVTDEQGRLINLKPLNPETIAIIVNRQGKIIRYEQSFPGQKDITSFSPEEIFHIPLNRIADEVHGLSEFEFIANDVSMKNEAKKDLKVVFHRYVKPLLISEVDSDDPSEISSYKNKLDLAMDKGENMVIPKGVATVDRVSIPQYSTLDPLPWIKHLSREIVLSQGTPEIILGSSSKEDTEASSKIVYLSYEQLIKFRQLIWEEAIKSQLGFEIKLKFAASIAPSLLEDNKKDGQNMSPDKIDPKKKQD